MENKNKKILIVDDDEYYVKSTCTLLKHEGYNVITALDGSKGLELAEKEHPDLMILDVMMAYNTEGMDISRKVPEMPELKNMKVIMVTGITREMNLPFKLEADESWLPVDTVLEKPVAPEKLLKEIKERLS